MTVGARKKRVSLLTISDVSEIEARVPLDTPQSDEENNQVEADTPQVELSLEDHVPILSEDDIERCVDEDSFANLRQT